MSVPRPSSPAEVRRLPDGPLHFVGIGGAGQSALAFIFAQRGRTVRGSDPGIAATTKARLAGVGCEIFTTHAAANVAPDTAAVIVTDAVNESNPEVAEALWRGLPVFRRPEALATLVNSAKTAICVAGTHGKTTTSAMVACILIHAGLNPTVVIGGDLALIGGNAQSGDPDLIVVEACEAYGGLDCLKPTIAIITNCEPDHLDFHGSEAKFRQAFLNFGRHIRPQGSIVFPPTRDLNRLVRDISAKSARDVAQISCSIESEDAFLYVTDVSAQGPTTAFSAYWNDHADFDSFCLGSFLLSVPGAHNLQNALLALGAAYAVYGGFPEGMFQGIGAFTGTGRRFERLGEIGDIAIVDDYAHHPTEIRATLQAARQAFPQRRIVAIFQPHLPSRTRDFLAGFADALSEANAVYLTDIYLAREPEQPGLIEALAAQSGATLVKDRFALPERLRRELKPGDVALFMGAGNIREQAEQLCQKS